MPWKYQKNGTPAARYRAAFNYGRFAKLQVLRPSHPVFIPITEVAMTAVFGGLRMGLCLTLVHLISIPVSNTSVNPARNTGPALFVPGGCSG